MKLVTTLKLFLISSLETKEEEILSEENQPAQRKKPTSLFWVSDEMLEATTTRSEEVSSSPDFPDSIEEKEEENGETSIIDNHEELELDVDSLDEGVGDVSSDGEHQLSPVTSSSCETVIRSQASPASSPVKERIPSRFSFSNT